MRSGKSKNVIVIVIDALRARNLSCYGYDKPTSPNLDRIAQDGILFEDAYACTDQTDVSFTTIFSGKYPLSHGIRHHGPEVTAKEIHDLKMTSTKFLPEMLVQKGYTTIGIDWMGKWHKRGFQIYGEPQDLRKYTDQSSSSSKAYLSRGIEKIKAILPSSIYSSLSKPLKSVAQTQAREFLLPRRVESCVECALQILRRTTSPFFLMLHLWDVHTPFYLTPKMYVSKFYHDEKGEKALDMALRIKNKAWRNRVLGYHLRGVRYVSEVVPMYDASINYTDHHLGEFLGQLRQLGVLDNTYLIVTADHGDNLMRNGIFKGHSGLYEDVLRVPLIVWGPNLPRGKRIRGLVQHVDIVPTILDLLKIHKKEFRFDGNSLIPMIEQGKTIRPYAFAVSSTANKRFALITDRFKYIYSPTREDAKDKYGIQFRDTRELYDLRNDPWEHENLSHEKPNVASEMEACVKDLVGMFVKRQEKAILDTKIRKLTTKLPREVT